MRRIPSPVLSWLGAALTIAAVAGVGAVGSVAQTPPPSPPKAPAPTAEQIEFFEKKVRPVLTAECVSCHGPTLQLGGVRLDTAAEARKALIPGDPAKSRLVRVLHYDGAIKMPPSGKRPDAEIAAIAAWVKMGAPWPEGKAATAGGGKAAPLLWSFQPVKRPALPAVKNAAWASTPVDRFLLAKLEAKGLAPAPAAGKRALIRRAYFDLTGLPPTPAEVEAFVADKAPDAWRKVVDRLLASPHFGERWARHWLDVARYADSNGLDENIAFANAWRYRDWVVGAMNRDLPYNRFLQEQIAGDLMDSGDDEELRNSRIAATGFLTLGAKVLAEPDKPKMVMDIVDEQIDVTTKAVMGLTVACARCHDHKFDPVSTKDYYALAGIFKSTKTMRSLATVAQINQRRLPTAALEARIKAYDETEIKPREAALKAARAAADAEVVAAIRRDSDKYLRAGFEYARQPGVLLSVAETEAKPGDPERHFIAATAFVRGNAVRDTGNYGKGVPDGVLITDKPPVSAEWEVTLPAAGRYQLELRYAAEESRPIQLRVNNKVVKKSAAGGVTGSWNADGQRWEAQGVYEFVAGKNTVKIERKDGPLPHFSRLLVVAAPSAPATPDIPDAPKPKTADEIAKRDGLIPSVVARFAQRLVGAPDVDSVKGRVLADKALFAVPEKAEAFYAGAAKDAFAKAQQNLDAANKAAPQVPVVMAVEEMPKPEDVKVHIRGNTLTLGEVAPRGFPVMLAKTCAADPSTPIDDRGSGRLALARWLTRPEHPLTARVAVNRVWQHLFGEGLVRTPDNWGVKGEKPTHPELLDYLADTFVREDGWSQKKLIRRLMLSSAYRMGTVSPAAAKAFPRDPENRLLWRANRRRLEAEPLRDAVLAVSGTLDLSLGGTLLTTGDGAYVTNDQSKDQAQYAAPRRSLYLPVVRNSLFDLFQVFDFGDGTTVNAHRASTTVAPQALFLMNSPLVRDSSLAFAKSLLSGTDAGLSDAARVRRAYYRAVARPATDAEAARAASYLSRYDAALAPLEPDPAKRRERAWQSLCQVILSSNEFAYLE